MLLFCMLLRYFVHKIASSPSFRCKCGQVYIYVRHTDRVYAASSSAAECLRLGGGRPTRAIGVTSTIVTGGSTIETQRDSDSNSNQSKHNDECLSAWTAPCASTTNRTPVIVHREGLLVGIVTVFTNAVVCRRSTLSTYPGPKILNIHLICQQLSTCAWTGHL